MNQKFYNDIELSCQESFLEGYNDAVNSLLEKMDETGIASFADYVKKFNGDKDKARAARIADVKAKKENAAEVTRRAKRNENGLTPEAIKKRDQARAQKAKKFRQQKEAERRAGATLAHNANRNALKDRRLTNAAKGAAVIAGGATVAKMAHDAYLNHKRNKREEEEFEAKKKRNFLFQEGYLAALEDMDLE